MNTFFELCKKHKLSCLIAVIFLAAGFALAFFYFKLKFTPKPNVAVFSDTVFKKIHPEQNAYPYINPLLAFDIGDGKPSLKYQNMQNQISREIAAAKSGRQVSQAAVYFRDLETGEWTGVNETEKFAPGSLLKVALMIAYYKSAEENPEILSKQLVWDAKEDANSAENIPPAQNIQPGKAYSADDLIRYMIIYSDNNAANLLLDNYDPEAFKLVFKDLMVSAEITDSTGDVISPKQLSFMFRLLYNATYLNKQFSSKALDLLVHSDYKSGLAAGLPANLPLADKFGERVVTQAISNNNVAQFHDCGIVYFPGHPYFLCVMTKGQGGSLVILQQTVAKISKIVYENYQSIEKSATRQAGE